jgi:predicted regulator of Ras-like GTPase activity (Roadblock/LC7/MglB family)
METNQRYPVNQLDWLLDDLVMRVPNITRSVFLSQDGLALGASRGMDQADVEHLAALAAAFQSLARSASHQFGGDARQSIIEMTSGFFIVCAAGQGTCLAVLTTTEADIGQVAYEMAVLVQRTGDHLQVNTRTRSALSGTLETGAHVVQRRSVARRGGRPSGPALRPHSWTDPALRESLRPGRHGDLDPGPDYGSGRARS